MARRQKSSGQVQKSEPLIISERVKQILHHFRSDHGQPGGLEYIPEEDRVFLFRGKQYMLTVFLNVNRVLTGAIEAHNRNGERVCVCVNRSFDGKMTGRAEDVLMYWEKNCAADFGRLYYELLDVPRVIVPWSEVNGERKKLREAAKKLPSSMASAVKEKYGLTIEEKAVVVAKKLGTLPPQLPPDIYEDTEKAKEGVFE